MCSNVGSSGLFLSGVLTFDEATGELETGIDGCSALLKVSPNRNRVEPFLFCLNGIVILLTRFD